VQQDKNVTTNSQSILMGIPTPPCDVLEAPLRMKF
jgi:hypothetical protein